MTLKEWRLTLKFIPDLIVQASTEDGYDGLTESSIGMHYNFANIDALFIVQNYQNGKFEKLVLNSFSPTTDEHGCRSDQNITRKQIICTLEKNGIPFNDFLNPDVYYNTLSDYKFVISPQGRGIDCHRHYEALIAGCIPVIEENDVIKNKYGNCPILYTKDYSEITEGYLNEKYEEFMNKDYDFSKLFLSYWDLTEQEKIKHRGNYWVNKYCHKSWY